MSVVPWKCIRCCEPVAEVDGETADCRKCGECWRCCTCDGRVELKPSVKATLTVRVNGQQMELPAEFFAPPALQPVILKWYDWKACPDRRMILQMLGVRAQHDLGRKNR